MHFVVVDTHRFVKISWHLYCCCRYLFNYLFIIYIIYYCMVNIVSLL